MPPIGIVGKAWGRGFGSAELHRRMFTLFSKYEIACGGPDPHMKMAERLALSSDDPLWVAGVYTAPYVVSTALAITDRWGRVEVLRREPEFTAWVEDNWGYLPIRKERRVNGMGPAKLAKVVVSYARWLEGKGLGRLKGMPFQEAFSSMDPPHYGRYFKMKLYEVLRRVLVATRAGVTLPAFEDILPRDGYHPRKGLRLLYPEHDYKSNRPEDLEEANTLSGELLRHFSKGNVKADWFTVEVLLCNYRQAVAGGQYPGRAHDSELGHSLVVGKGFPDIARRVKQCRATLFNPLCLGEVGNRWSGRRKELGKVMMEHGYVWSDLVYDYGETVDPSKPVRRGRCALPRL